MFLTLEAGIPFSLRNNYESFFGSSIRRIGISGENMRSLLALAQCIGTVQHAFLKFVLSFETTSSTASM